MKNSLLTLLRDKNTSLEAFRHASHRLGSILAAEVAQKLHEKPKDIETPLSPMQGAELSANIILIPILRAGMALLPPFLSLFPKASVGFFGIKRDEATAKPIEYYENIPPFSPKDALIILDPMIATGGSAHVAVKKLLSKGATLSQIQLAGVIGATDGIAFLHSHHPGLPITVAGIDKELNSHKFIVPGLGDFGDRYFGT